MSKLYENDSLVFLYLLSSSVFTILFLIYLVSFWTVINRNIQYKNCVLFFIITSYFLYDLNNRNYALLCIQTSNVNISLQNGLLNIHPPLIYYMYAGTINLLIRTYFILHLSKFNINKSSFLYNILVFAMVGMYLGAIWAVQELNWGGFWSWDPVEIISLIGTLFYIKRLHNQPQVVFNQTAYLYFIIVWVVYIVIRLGVVATIHSFIRSNNIMLYVNISILCIVIYSLLVSVFKIKIYFYFVNYCLIKTLFYRLQINCLLVYTYIYLLYLTSSSNVNFILPRLHNFFILIMLVIVISNYFFYTVLGNVNICHVVINIILLLYFNIQLNIFSIIVLIFYLYASRYSRFSNSNLNIHLILFFIYIVYFLFMINIPIYNSIVHRMRLIYNINNNSFSSSCANHYENFFFLKKQFLLNKFKNCFHHVSGFYIISNYSIAFFAFTKNFTVNYLFSLEILYFLPIVAFIFVMSFTKIKFYLPLNNHISLNV